MRIERLDHLVLTVADVDATVAFYRDVLGMEAVTFKGDRKALNFGNSKINLHQHGHEFEPKARWSTPGSADLCFIVDEPVEQVIRTLQGHGLAIEEGPVVHTGAAGSIVSCYLRDPDLNLIELSNYLT